MSEKERFAVHVRPEQILAAVESDGSGSVSGDAVADALKNLSDPAWGNVLAGMRIASGLRSRVLWTPWRFSAGDYLEAAGFSTSQLALVGRPVDAPWDADLSPAMVRTGRAVEEEAVAELLAADFIHSLINPRSSI